MSLKFSNARGTFSGNINNNNNNSKTTTTTTTIVMMMTTMSDTMKWRLLSTMLATPHGFTTTFTIFYIIYTEPSYSLHILHTLIQYHML